MYMTIYEYLFNKEYKISKYFGKPEYNIDIYIDDIKIVKQIFDNFKNIKKFISDDIELNNIIIGNISPEQELVNDYLLNI